MKNIRIIIPLILFAAVFVSCSSADKSIYNFDYPLTAEQAHSASGDITVSIPGGWFEALDNDCNCRELWLVKDDYSASISFSVINTDSLTKTGIAKNELAGIAELSRDFKKIKYGEKFREYGTPENFSVNSIKFYSYQYYAAEGLPARVVVFKFNDRYFECAANYSSENSGKELFAVQNSVLVSIK